MAALRDRVLASPAMTRNTAPARHEMPLPSPQPMPRWTGGSVVLVGLMGAGKSAIGRRLAARIGLAFHDADSEIELAAGCSIAEIFARYGESAFRDGERRVISRLLAGPHMVLATGGGAFMDPRTRSAVRAAATSVWLRVSLPVLARRVAGRDHRPLLVGADPMQVLTELAARRYPAYAEADIVVDCGDEQPEHTTTTVLDAVIAWSRPHRVPVWTAGARYDVVIGDGLIARAGALLAPVLPQPRAIVVTDAAVAALHLDALLASLARAGIAADPIVVAAGEASKSLHTYGQVVDGLLARGAERRTAVIALGGGVVGDLAGFAAATTLRGLPFVQVPTTLLAQVDSSVGGKTGINTARGKNLLGAFHQPLMVIADTAALATLPARELRAGYAEIAKAGVIGDAALYAWCEAHGAAVIAGGRAARAEAVRQACAFKARVVAADEREEAGNDGRALLNLGHTFGHALEAEYGFDGGLLHGEAVSVGIGLALRLSARLGVCAVADAERVVAHLASVGLPAELAMLNRRFSAAALAAHMRRDKKMRDGVLHFVLARGIGGAFTSRDVPEAAVLDLLRAEGCDA